MSAAVEVARSEEQAKEDRLLLFENSPFGLALCESSGDVIATNHALNHLLGDDPLTSQPLSFSDLIHPSDRPQTQRGIAELLHGKRESFQVDSRTISAQSRPVRWTVWKVGTKDGQKSSILMLAEELPGVAAAEQRLRQAECLEAVGRLAGGVAHDFNNLLTGVLLYCDLLMASMEPLHRARHYAEEIRKAGLQATGLVRQLLAVARPTSAQPRLLSLNEIVEGMRNLLVRLVGENIELDQRLAPDLGLVKMDPTQAQQILLNLVLNARDAMPLGGVIAVKTSNCDVQVLADSPTGSSNKKPSLPCALFVVEDNGHGMDESTRVRVFEPFFTTKASKGNGMGLATVHDIVTTNGGLIHVDSEVGRGTRVSVLLPLVPESLPSSCNNGPNPVRNGEIHSFKKEE